MVFHWNLSDSKSLQVSQTLPSIIIIIVVLLFWEIFTLMDNESASPCTRFSGFQGGSLVM